MKLLATTTALALMAGVANANPYAEYYELSKTTEELVLGPTTITKDFYTCEMDLMGLLTSQHLWYWLGKIADDDWDDYENYLKKIYSTDNEVSIFSQQKMCLIKAAMEDNTPLIIFSQAPTPGYTPPPPPPEFPNYNVAGIHIEYDFEPQSIDYEALHEAHSELEDIITEDLALGSYSGSGPDGTNIAMWAGANEDSGIIHITLLNLINIPENNFVAENCDPNWGWFSENTVIDIDPLPEWLNSGDAHMEELRELLEAIAGNVEHLELHKHSVASQCLSREHEEIGPYFAWEHYLQYTYNPPEIEE